MAYPQVLRQRAVLRTRRFGEFSDRLPYPASILIPDQEPPRTPKRLAVITRPRCKVFDPKIANGPL